MAVKERKVPLLSPSSFTNNAPEDKTAESKERVDSALGLAALGQAKFAANGLSQVVYQLPTTDVDTLAVTMGGDGTRFLLWNPEFVCSLETGNDVLFILVHEWGHLALMHLVREPEKRNDPLWTLVCETIINAMVLALLGRRDMPRTVKTVDGMKVAVPSGVDPREVYEKRYKAPAKKAGITDIVTYEKFVSDEHTCYAELKRVPEPTKPPQFSKACLHGDPSGGEGDGPMGDGIQVDQEALDEAMKEAIQTTMTEARRGNDEAREELLKLAGLTEEGNEEAQKMWGLYGLGGLRGKTDAAREVPYWKTWLNDAVGSRLQPGSKLMIPQKRLGVTMMLGLDPTFARRGDEELMLLDIYLDTSGSMPDKTVKEISDLVGEIPGVLVRWYMFDGVVMPLVPGETVHGGGGTNFQNCVDVAEGRVVVEGDEERVGDPDCVLMLTDGYAAHVEPEAPDKWVWLITKGGDTWPEHTDMACHEVDFSEAG